jgi:hypothetical protein
MRGMFGVRKIDPPQDGFAVANNRMRRSQWPCLRRNFLKILAEHFPANGVRAQRISESSI